MQAKQNDEFIYYFPSAGRCSAVSRKAGLHQAQCLLGNTNAITPNVPLSSFFPEVFIAEHDVIWCDISL